MFLRLGIGVATIENQDQVAIGANRGWWAPLGRSPDVVGRIERHEDPLCPGVGNGGELAERLETMDESSQSPTS